jgi:hypothetical protein
VLRFNRKFEELLLSTIADLTTSVTALTAAVAAIPAATAPGATVLSAADQAALDANVTAIDTATKTLTGDVTPPVAAAAVAPEGGGSSYNP